jgi:hypothetical protein
MFTIQQYFRLHDAKLDFSIHVRLQQPDLLSLHQFQDQDQGYPISIHILFHNQIFLGFSYNPKYPFLDYNESPDSVLE